MQRRTFSIPGIAFLLGLCLWLFSCLVQQPTVQAAAYVMGSNPIDGSTIEVLPGTIHIFFSTPISTLSTATAYAIKKDGQLQRVNDRLTFGEDQREIRLPISDASQQASGSYEVFWTAIASDDGRTTHGLIGFNVGYSNTGMAGQATLGPSSSNNLTGPDGSRLLNPLSVVGIVWEWFALLALMLWIGILAIEQILLRGTQYSALLLDRARPKTLTLQWMSLFLLLLSEIIVLCLRVLRATQHIEHDFFSTLMTFLLETNYGHLWLLRLALLCIVMFLLSQSIRRSRKMEPAPAPEILEMSTGPLRMTTNGEVRAFTTGSLTKDRERLKLEASTPTPSLTQRFTPLWLLFAALILLTYVFSGPALEVKPTMSSLIFSWLLLAAQAIWFGGIIYLSAILLPLLIAIKSDQHAEVLTTLLRRTSPMLLVGLGVWLITSIFFAEANLNRLDQLWSDPYGLTILIEGGIVLLIIPITIYLFFWLRPKLKQQALLLPVVSTDRPGRRRREFALKQSEMWLKYTMILLAVLGAGVLLASSFLNFFAPPPDFPVPPSASTSTTSNNASFTKQINGYTIFLQVLPGKLAVSNSIVVTVLDQQLALVNNAAVEVVADMTTMDMGGPQRLALVSGNGTYTGTFTSNTAFSMTGVWTIDLTVHIADQDLPPIRFFYTLQ